MYKLQSFTLIKGSEIFFNVPDLQSLARNLTASQVAEFDEITECT